MSYELWGKGGLRFALTIDYVGGGALDAPWLRLFLCGDGRRSEAVDNRLYEWEENLRAVEAEQAAGASPCPT